MCVEKKVNNIILMVKAVNLLCVYIAATMLAIQWDGVADSGYDNDHTQKWKNLL